MTPATLLSALALPSEARLGQRVPKKLLLEHGAPTAADRRLVREGVESAEWVAVLKPTTIGVPAHRDAEREYLEIHVLSLALRRGAREPRLSALVHRAVPYPVLLIAEQEGSTTVSAAEKRWSLGEAGRMVLDGDVVSASWTRAAETPVVKAFMEALAVSRQPRTDLRGLYQGWLNALAAQAVSQVSGTFRLAASQSEVASRLAALASLEALEKELAGLRADAARTRQMARRVELNLTIQRLTARQAELLTQL